jgi:1,4-alpha-glucan branching enzyme
MIKSEPRKGRVQFTLRPEAAAKEAFLAGDFTDWQPVPMARRKGGSFAIAASLRHGRYEYKYIVDGKWIVDPDTSMWAENPFGSVNSVVEVS